MSTITERLDCDVRVAVYSLTVANGRPPTASGVADRLVIPESAVQGSFEEAEALLASLNLTGPFWNLR